MLVFVTCRHRSTKDKSPCTSWQSRVEIKGYSIAYFDLEPVTVFYVSTQHMHMVPELCISHSNNRSVHNWLLHARNGLATTPTQWSLATTRTQRSGYYTHAMVWLLHARNGLTTTRRQGDLRLQECTPEEKYISLFLVRLGPVSTVQLLLDH